MHDPNPDEIMQLTRLGASSLKPWKYANGSVLLRAVRGVRMVQYEIAAGSPPEETRKGWRTMIAALRADGEGPPGES